jgi:hypothetical protein
MSRTHLLLSACRELIYSYLLAMINFRLLFSTIWDCSLNYSYLFLSNKSPYIFYKFFCCFSLFFSSAYSHLIADYFLFINPWWSCFSFSVVYCFWMTNCLRSVKEDSDKVSFYLNLVTSSKVFTFISRISLSFSLAVFYFTYYILIYFSLFNS